MKLRRQIAMIIAVILLFAAFNIGLYKVVTKKLSNNFSGVSQTMMIKVADYLPFSENSKLVKVDTNLKLTDNLPVIDGATALVPIYAAVIDNIYPEGCVTYEGGSFSSDNEYGENFAEDSAMQYNSTVRGYKAIVDGTTDILICGAPSEAQKQYAADNGVELVWVPIGREGFVFFVNQNNPVYNLTSDQIRKIYAGEYKNWKEVGGVNRIINPVTRAKGSGSQTNFEAFMGDTEIGTKSPLAFTGASIGFSFRFYMTGIVGNDSVKILSVDGVYPSAENISNGTYPILSQFYAIYRADNENENVSVVVDWIVSDEGQSLIEKTGYVRIN